MNDVKLNGMRELNFNEIEEVSGGIIPLIVGVYFAGVLAGTAIGWVASRILK